MDSGSDLPPPSRPTVFDDSPAESTPLDFYQFWEKYYAHRHAEARASEEQWQDEAFACQPHTVCGLSLRGMSAYDLLILSGYENPFVVGGVPTPESVAQFLVLLVDPPPRSWFARRRLFKAIAAYPFAKAIHEIYTFRARMFASADIPAPSADPAAADDTAAGSPPVNTCFIAPLVIRLAGATGWPEEHILSMRLDKLFQYRRAIRADDHEARPQYPAADKLISEALNAHTRYLSTGELPA